MIRILFLLAIIGVILAILNWRTVRRKLEDKNTRVKWIVGLGLLLLALLMLSGRMHWVTGVVAGLFAAVASALRFAGPALFRLFPLLHQLYSRHQATKAFQSDPDSGTQSKVETAILSMTLDHDTGELSGTVTRGKYAGNSLSDLDQEQLSDLYHYCMHEDGESAQLLASYLDRRFEDWRTPFGEESVDSGPVNTSEMSRQEALSILGIEEGADNKAIVDAHRKLMQKVHPDRGGSDYLAAKVNQAKDSLIG